MDQAWYFTRGGQQEGPVEWAALQKLAADRQLAPNDEVWTAGFAQWTAASSVPDLFNPASAPAEPTAAPAPAAAPQPVAAVQMQSSPVAAVTLSPVIPIIDYGAIGGERFSFAPFFMRVMACIIDGLIVIAIGFGVSIAFAWWVGDDAINANKATFRTFVRVMFVLVSWIYCASLESSSAQSTFGKRLLGMKVTDMSGNPISFARASARHFGKYLSEMVFMIGYLMMKYSPNNQCLHDMLAGCVVIKKDLT